MSKKLLIAIVVAVVILTGLICIWSVLSPNQPGSLGQQAIEQKSNEIDKETASWSEYANPLLGYKLQYPQELRTDFSDPNNVGFFENVPTTKISGPAYSVSIYPVTVEPYTDLESAVIASSKFNIRKKGEPEPAQRPNAGGWSVSEDENITIGGVAAVRQYSDDEGGSYVNVFVPLSSIQFLVIHGAKVSVNSSQDKDAYFDGLFSKMLATLQLLALL